MTRLFGYLIPHIDSAGGEEAARFAAEVARPVPGVQMRSDTMHAASRASSCCHAPYVLRVGELIISLAGYATWRGQRVSHDSNLVLSQIADQYRSSGKRFLDHLQGSFVITILDDANKKVILAIDRMGVERLTYAEHLGGLVFGTSAHAVANFPGVTRAIRDQALYDFLIFHMVPAPSTVYQGVGKLRPATVLVFEDGEVHLQRYWQPTYNYARRRDFPELKTKLLDSLANAIRTTGLEEPTGAFLSGGLDSSSIVGTLAGVSASPAKTFTVGFGEDEYDELSYAHIANQEFGCTSFEYHMAPSDIVDAFPRIASAYDEPFGNSSAAPTYFCAKLAADNGVTHLLAGDGGDELFGGNERYVRQRIFEMYQSIPLFLRNRLIEPATRAISPDSGLFLLRKMRSYVDQAMIPLPERFESWNLTYREGSEHMLTPQFASEVNTNGPLRVMNDVWQDAPSENKLEKMLWYDWHFTLADNDLRKVGTMCELAGVRVSYPMLNDSMVELSTQISPTMKVNGTELRWFFKRAMSGLLPREIIQKKKHGFGLPFGLWLKSDPKLRDLIFSNLADLEKRQIIAPEFIDNLIQQHRTGHASYFGYALWDFAMLEEWMKHHADRSVTSY